MQPKEVTTTLTSWRTLNNALRHCDEEACKTLLDAELAQQARLAFLNRIHGAYNKKRFARERMNLAEAARNP